jgi:predicted dehydrogenase
MLRLKGAIRSGRLGTIATISAEQTALHGLALTEDAWRAQVTESPGGAMTAIGVHLVDGMIDLQGPIAEVFCRVHRRAAIFADDTTDILLRFDSGASGHIFCSTVATPNYRMAAYGTGGFAEILGHPMATFRLVPAIPGQHRTTGPAEIVETSGFNMLTAELEEFAAAIASRTHFPTPLPEILHGVEVFEAILASAASGRPEAVQRAL